MTTRKTAAKKAEQAAEAPPASARRSHVELLERWNAPGATGFFNWLEDVRPVIPGGPDGFVEYRVPNERVRKEIERGLAPGVHTWCISFPRRYGKTSLSALVLVWRFMRKRGNRIGIAANSERQGADTLFRIVRAIVTRTPQLAGMVKAGHIVVTETYVGWPKAASRIDAFPANPASLHGKRLGAAAISELHAARGGETLETLQAATLDTEDGLTLVDSTVGPQGSTLHRLYLLAQSGADPTLVFSHIEYRDIEEAIADAPPWIAPERLRSRAAQLLPAQFAVEHLNQWAAADNAAFPADVIELCRDDYPLDAKEVAGGRAYVVGAGLDRALMVSLHGDATILATVAKVLSDGDDEPHYYVLDCHKFSLSTEFAIKRHIEKMRKQFGVTRIVIERYEGQDLALWCDSIGLSSRIEHASAKTQAVAFLAMVNAAREGRLHVHKSMERVFREMGTFQYELRAHAQSGQVTPHFGHARGAHDDTLYAIAWAMVSLADVELQPYTITGIACSAKRPLAQMCILNGGAVVPLCRDRCRSMAQVEELHRQYLRRVTREPLGLEDFFAQKVSNEGSHSAPR
ncbi:terminase large subunit [Nostoc sp. NIES-2111]